AKKGTKERYLKNESELAEFLLNSSLDGVQIKAGGKTLAVSEVVASLKSAVRFGKSIDRLARRIHPEILRGLISHGVTAKTLESEETLKSALATIAKEAIAKDVHFEYTVAKDAEHNTWFATLVNTVHGSKRSAPLNLST